MAADYSERAHHTRHPKSTDAPNAMRKPSLVARNTESQAPQASHIITRLVPDPLRPGHTIARKYVKRPPIAKTLHRHRQFRKPDRQPIVEYDVGENRELQYRADDKLEDMRSKWRRKLCNQNETVMLLKNHAKVLVSQRDPLCALVTTCPNSATYVGLGLLAVYEDGKSNAAFPTVRALLKQLRSAAVEKYLLGGTISTTCPLDSPKVPSQASASPSSITAAF